MAKSVDWTVGIGLDVRGCVARVERFQRPWEETITAIVQATGSVSALVDSTGVGDPVLDALQRRGRGGGGQFEGFKFSAPAKNLKIGRAHV